MLRKLLQKLFGIQGAAYTGATPVIFTDIYKAADGWSFSFHDAKHKDGGIWGPYETQQEAVENREVFVANRKGTEFVHQGVAYMPPYFRRVM